MLLTKKSEYAILALIAISKSNQPKNVDELAKELEISKSFLAKIMQNLSKHNVVNSYKGANGGFVLAKPSELITIFEITSIAEEKIPSVFECSPSINCCPSQKGACCGLWPTLNKLQNKINLFLSDLTLKELVE
ncbi:Rrf2 family transcriptional regulator [Arcobacter sp. FWKO B]|uniref:Rrf2 family transcriptional regulator n=1 Tax=Arcobacter sp. FWKO B TaxID=2593672 RepID=UPI0018A667BC|nr:Rrf2 family transcriptional regulator [Arcobacter sp. FWKO B]QOG12655.1 Rrf2 family transcriptional regulator [Arcobacter sp. FWKO B]